jgi:thiamine-phosphate pyrophosphorylase
MNMPKEIAKLHYITQDVPGLSHSKLAQKACEGGANWVQLRLKNKSESECLIIAEEVKAICKKFNAKLIINDNVNLAKMIQADGVHLGKRDMAVSEARKILGKNFIIGGTANTQEDVVRLNTEGVDYIGLGPFRFTVTKENLSPILGLNGIKKAAENSKIPVIAIGGITHKDVKEIMNTGVYGIAVSSAINFSKDKSLAVKKFNELLHQFQNKCSHTELVKV